MKKALSHDFVMFGVFLLVIILGSALVYDLFRYSADQKIVGGGQEAISDANLALQGIKHSFEKTASFFGLMNTAKELGEHGGLSESKVGEASTFDPVMRVSNNIPYFAPIEDGSIKKRMPFVYSEDMNLMITGQEEAFPIIFASTPGEKLYGENLADVAAGKYAFNAVVQIFMRNTGIVTVEVYQQSCRDSSPACKKIIQVTESGDVQISIGSDVVKNSNEDVWLSVQGV